MGEAAVIKSPDFEDKESLVSTMVKEIKHEREREKEKDDPSYVERTIVQSGVDFDRCEEASVEEKCYQMAPSHGVWYYTTDKFRRGRL